jgi:hypothetical protein
MFGQDHVRGHAVLQTKKNPVAEATGSVPSP